MIWSYEKKIEFLLKFVKIFHFHCDIKIKLMFKYCFSYRQHEIKYSTRYSKIISLRFLPLVPLFYAFQSRFKQPLQNKFKFPLSSLIDPHKNLFHQLHNNTPPLPVDHVNRRKQIWKRLIPLTIATFLIH